MEGPFRRTPGGVAGMVLTGGSSRRMGADKASLVVDGSGLATRVGVLLASVCTDAVEVGTGVTGLPHTREDPPGEGPLAAIVAGWRLLRRRGHTGDVVVLACDLPLLDRPVVERLARWPQRGSIVPLAGGVPQPLCARWSSAALDAACGLLATTRSMHRLAELPDTHLVDAELLGAGPDGRALLDVDCPADLAALGLRAGETRENGGGVVAAAMEVPRHAG